MKRIILSDRKNSVGGGEEGDTNAVVVLAAAVVVVDDEDKICGFSIGTFGSVPVASTLSPVTDNPDAGIVVNISTRTHLELVEMAVV